MATVETTARELSRAKREANRRRKEAVRRRLVEAVLVRRARLLSVREIADELDAMASDVRKILTDARIAGDERALTDREIAARAKPVPAEASTVGRHTPEEDIRVPEVEPIAAGAFLPARTAFIGRLRDVAAECRVRSPKASAGLEHLADLHEHCDTRYPSLNIPSQGVTLEETNRRFPPASSAGFSSPALLCVEG